MKSNRYAIRRFLADIFYSKLVKMLRHSSASELQINLSVDCRKYSNHNPQTAVQTPNAKLQTSSSKSMLYLQSFHHDQHHIVLQHFTVDLLFASVPRFDTAYCMQYDEDRGGRIDLVYLSSCTTFCNVRRQVVQVGAAPVLESEEVRVEAVVA